MGGGSLPEVVMKLQVGGRGRGLAHGANNVRATKKEKIQVIIKSTYKAFEFIQGLFLIHSS